MAIRVHHDGITYECDTEEDVKVIERLVRSQIGAAMVVASPPQPRPEPRRSTMAEYLADLPEMQRKFLSLLRQAGAGGTTADEVLPNLGISRPQLNGCLSLLTLRAQKHGIEINRVYRKEESRVSRVREYRYYIAREAEEAMA